MARVYTVFEVLYHVDDDHSMAHGGPAGDGSFIARFRDEERARSFAARHEYCGQPCKVSRCDNVPQRLVSRWSFQG